MKMLFLATTAILLASGAVSAQDQVRAAPNASSVAHISNFDVTIKPADRQGPYIPQQGSVGEYRGNSPIDAGAAFQDQTYTFFQKTENMDLVIAGTVENSRLQSAVGGLPETYAILYISGNYATGQGPQQIQGLYQLRVPGEWIEQNGDLIGQQAIFLIEGNGEKHNPVQQAYWVHEGSPRFNAQPILSINTRGEIDTGRQFNQCELEDYHRIYNPDEDLALVYSFTCEDGTQWNRGNEQPADYDSTPMTAVEMIDEVSGHYRNLGRAMPNIERGMRTPTNRVLNPENDLEKTRQADQMWREILTEWPPMPEESKSVLDHKLNVLFSASNLGF